jgi:hypothetical protein
MNVAEKKYHDPKFFRRLVWDYSLSPRDFFAILHNERAEGTFTQDWAIARVIENAPYYDALTLVPLTMLRTRWERVRSRVFNRDIVRGYEFVLRRDALPTTR